MFKRELRLPATTRLLQSRTITSPLCILKIAKNGLSYSRFGFIVSKKTASSAVERNRTKRKFRACIESKQQLILPGYDMLFILSKNLIEEPEERICQEVQILLNKGGVIQ